MAKFECFDIQVNTLSPEHEFHFYDVHSEELIDKISDLYHELKVNFIDEIKVYSADGTDMEVKIEEKIVLTMNDNFGRPEEHFI